MASQECDCDFSTSGDTVIEPDILNFYESTYIQEPVERRGIDGNLWVWQIPDYSKDYIVVADVARGDGCLLYTSPSPRDRQKSRMPSSA